MCDCSEWLCNRIVDSEAGENPQMPFSPALLFLVLTQFPLKMSQKVSVGKAQLGGGLSSGGTLGGTTKVDNHDCTQKYHLIPRSPHS